jgi:hypothetical protein
MTATKDEAFDRLMAINEQLNKLDLFPSLGWTWVFDIIKDIYENTDTGYDEAITEGVTLKQIFDKLYDDIEKLDLNTDLGGELIEEALRDWMRDSGFIVDLQDEEEDEEV